MSNAPVIFRVGNSSTGPVYTTDGTPGGTSLISGVQPGQGLGTLGNGLGIYAGDYSSAFGGAPIYLTDGTAGGTTLFGAFPFLSSVIKYTPLRPGLDVFFVGPNLWVIDAAGAAIEIKHGAVDTNYATGVASLGNGKAVYYDTDARSG